MQAFPPLFDFSYLFIPLTLRMVRPVTTWYFILECLSILTYRSGMVYSSYCTLVANLFITTILLYFNICLTFKLVQKHIHYRLGQSLIDVAQDIQVWISMVEMIALLVFLALAYKKYKELRAKDTSDKPHELFG